MAVRPPERAIILSNSQNQKGNVMPKKVKIKTTKNDDSVEAFLDTVEPERLKEDSYTYYRANGDEGTFMATGFSPRKSGPTLYIMPGYQDYSEILAELGKHKLGKSCLYLKNLDGINMDVLATLIQQGLDDLKSKHETNY